MVVTAHLEVLLKQRRRCMSICFSNFCLIIVCVVVAVGVETGDVDAFAWNRSASCMFIAEQFAFIIELTLVGGLTVGCLLVSVTESGCLTVSSRLLVAAGDWILSMREIVVVCCGVGLHWICLQLGMKSSRVLCVSCITL